MTPVARIRASQLTPLLLSVTALGGMALVASPPVQRERTKTDRAITKVQNPSSSKSKPVESDIVHLDGKYETTRTLSAGQVVEISVHLEKPSALPANGRLSVEWRPESEITVGAPIAGSRAVDAFAIARPPHAGFRKVLHALDADVYTTFRAPISGKYHLTIQPVINEDWVGESGARWREKGNVMRLASLPASTPWPTGMVTDVRLSIKNASFGTSAEEVLTRNYVECEPNDSPELAQPIEVSGGPGIETYEITGGSDDIEYFDNGSVGKSGDDWFKVHFGGREPRLLTAQLSMPGQMVAARIRAYKFDGNGNGSWKSGDPLLPVSEYKDGGDGNERVHQQDEEHRAEISRMMKPGETYFLRVESNAPGYQLQLRCLKPAPYDDPQMAVRQAVYTQIGQVDAWLTNRPRGASVERRIRETGNLLGTHCMSCHTQSGVWGPAVPFSNGYKLENAQNFWHLTNVMYECLRPCNELRDAVNNTSLAPLDIGDGPAGTRAAGFNIVNAERIQIPGKLHSRQQIRTANYVLLTADPGGINAAGPGSNIGFVVVNLFSTEILKTSWLKSGEPRFFRGLMQKARQVAAVDPKFTDDVALRLDYFYRVVPIDKLVEWSERAAKQEAALEQPSKKEDEPVGDFVERVRKQLTVDEARLRAIQNPDGSWGFNPGTSPDKGQTWVRSNEPSDPSPTALGIMGLHATGATKDDPAVAKAVKALLAMQDPTGRWNKAAQTGFVTTAYAMHALARLYPITTTTAKPGTVLLGTAGAKSEDLVARPGEPLINTIRRVRSLALTARSENVQALANAATHSSPWVRYWAVIGLGAASDYRSVVPTVTALGDRTKMVREAAVWAMRQLILDDKGLPQLLFAAQTGNDYVRECAWQAMRVRADAVSPKPALNWPALNSMWDQAINRDPHPAVRAWAARSATEWWIWNAPARTAVNAAWITMMERPEANILVENSNRYSSQALFIANGHKANGSSEHQYKELAALFEEMDGRMERASAVTKRLMARRLTAISGTFFQTAGGDGGPGQMGYITPSSGDLFGHAALNLLKENVQNGDTGVMHAALEGATGVPNRELTEWLVNFSLKGPEELRRLAAGAISDPRIVTLAAVPEQVEPQLIQVRRGAMEPARRSQVSDPIIDLWARVNWSLPKTEEQQNEFFNIIIPKFDNYSSTAEISANPDAAARTQIEREMSANWYLADRLGEVLERNPDLHVELVLLKYFPAKIRNPLEAHYWLRNVGWLLTYKGAMEKMNKAFKGALLEADHGISRTVSLQNNPATPQKVDPLLTVKDRVLQLYLDMLKPESEPKSRSVAIRMANQTALRTNPEVLRALSDLLPSIKNTDEKKIIENVLKQATGNFVPELMAALKSEKHASVTFSSTGEPQLMTAQRDDILYFRDYVMPELSRQKRLDQQSCMGCHGVPGRVPSFTVKAPDDYGYIGVADLLRNYRIFQSKVNLTDLERSKLLRKPLNIQDGKEDGHQGGRRYAPNDDGYLVLKTWVSHQPEVQKSPVGASRNNEVAGGRSRESEKEGNEGILEPSEVRLSPLTSR